jgi:hypothetical protein
MNSGINADPSSQAAAAVQNAAAADDEAFVYEEDTPDDDAIQAAAGLVSVISLLLLVLFCIIVSLYTSQAASYEFIHCFDLVKSLQCCLPQEKSKFVLGTSKLACTSAWLFEPGHLHLIYLCT